LQHTLEYNALDVNSDYQSTAIFVFTNVHIVITWLLFVYKSRSYIHLVILQCKHSQSRSLCKICVGAYFLHLRIQSKRHCQQRTLSSELANFVSNVSKRAQFSCQCYTVYLRSATIVTRLTEDDDVMKSLRRGVPAHRSCIGPRIC